MFYLVDLISLLAIKLKKLKSIPMFGFKLKSSESIDDMLCLTQSFYNFKNVCLVFIIKHLVFWNICFYKFMFDYWWAKCVLFYYENNNHQTMESKHKRHKNQNRRIDFISFRYLNYRIIQGPKTVLLIQRCCNVYFSKDLF